MERRRRRAAERREPRRRDHGLKLRVGAALAGMVRGKRRAGSAALHQRALSAEPRHGRPDRGRPGIASRHRRPGRSSLQDAGRAGARLAPRRRPCKACERAALLLEVQARGVVGRSGLSLAPSAGFQARGISADPAFSEAPRRRASFRLGGELVRRGGLLVEAGARRWGRARGALLHLAVPAPRVTGPLGLAHQPTGLQDAGRVARRLRPSGPTCRRRDTRPSFVKGSAINRGWREGGPAGPCGRGLGVWPRR